MTPAAIALAIALALPVPGPAPTPAPGHAPPGGPAPARVGALVRLGRGVRPYVRLAGMPVGGLLPSEAEIVLDHFAHVHDRAPVEAGLDRRTGAILAAREGVRLDKAATRRALFAAPPFARVVPIMRRVPARWQRADIGRLTAPVGAYTTWISGTLERRENIVIASRLLRYRLLYPGQVFSFVRAVGPGSRAQGYRLAPTIQDGQMVPGLGGGVCQLSSTVYNAARRAGLVIVERHRHGLPVAYVPAGHDATVVLPGEHPPAWLTPLDLRIRNDRPTPVYLDARVTGWRLTVRVMGDAATPRATARAAAPGRP